MVAADLSTFYLLANPKTLERHTKGSAARARKGGGGSVQASGGAGLAGAQINRRGHRVVAMMIRD